MISWYRLFWQYIKSFVISIPNHVLSLRVSLKNSIEFHAFICTLLLKHGRFLFIFATLRVFYLRYITQTSSTPNHNVVENEITIKLYIGANWILVFYHSNEHNAISRTFLRVLNENIACYTNYNVSARSLCPAIA